MKMMNEKNKIPPFPKYVSIGAESSMCALRLESVKNDIASYHREAGAWSVEGVRDGWRFCAKSIHDHLNGLPLRKITKEEHDTDNAGYV